MDRCEREQIVAYIEGELDCSASEAFERHIETCNECRNELTVQRLFLCELDAVMTSSPAVPAPQNFARIVAAHAETDMRGVRSRAENKRALRFIIILSLAAFSLLGASAIQMVIGGGRALAVNAFGLAGFVWRTAYETASSAAVIFRVVSRKLFIESGSLGLLVVCLCLALLVLSRLIASYHRTRTIE
jgi:anti-sigma factor RsiW